MNEIKRYMRTKRDRPARVSCEAQPEKRIVKNTMRRQRPEERRSCKANHIYVSRASIAEAHRNAPFAVVVYISDNLGNPSPSTPLILSVSVTFDSVTKPDNNCDESSAHEEQHAGEAHQTPDWEPSRSTAR